MFGNEFLDSMAEIGRRQIENMSIEDIKRGNSVASLREKIIDKVEHLSNVDKLEQILTILG